jgi:hypothetical protein
METKAGKLARLPDGQLVRIGAVHDDGQATVRRVEGERRGTIAVCDASKLQLARVGAFSQKRWRPVKVCLHY